MPFVAIIAARTATIATTPQPTFAKLAITADRFVVEINQPVNANPKARARDGANFKSFLDSIFLISAALMGA
jgi:hypothetical protein